MTIGTGELPAAADAPEGTSGWYVPPESATDAPRFYTLGTVAGAPAWIEQSERLLREGDPVLSTGGALTTLASVAASGGALDPSAYVTRTELASDAGTVQIHGGYF